MNIVLKWHSLDGKASCPRLPNVGAVTSESRHYSSNPFSRLGRGTLSPPCPRSGLQLIENHLCVVLHAPVSEEEKACFGNCYIASGYAKALSDTTVSFSGWL